MKQKIIFTALPNGTNHKTGKLKLSVAINLQVPDAPPDTTLKSLELQDMRHWAALVNNVKFNILLNGAPIVFNKTSKPADENLWANLFTDSLKVTRYEPPKDITSIPILSYPVKHIINHIKAIVRKTGNQYINDLPDADYYSNNKLFTDISNYNNTELTVAANLKNTYNYIKDRHAAIIERFKDSKNKNLIPFNPFPEPNIDFAQICNFHGMYDLDSVKYIKETPIPDFEFHDILSVLTQYPKLLRLFGLVVDFEIAVPPDTYTQNAEQFIQILPSGVNFQIETDLVCPSTSFERGSKGGFYAKERVGSFQGKGYVKINSDAFHIFQMDADGAALKITSHIDSLLFKKARNNSYALNSMTNPEAVTEFDMAYFTNESEPKRQGLPPNRKESKREGLPSNRTAGIAIAKNGMAEHLNDRFDRIKKLVEASKIPLIQSLGFACGNGKYYFGREENTQDDNVTLYADDVNIGYRMDVRMTGDSKTEGWNSLHFNDNVYSYVDVNGKTVTINEPDREILEDGDSCQDEGFIQLSTTEDKNLESPHIKLSEVIARWEGWSLAVPMPGKSLKDPMLSGGGKEADSQLNGNVKEVEENDEDESKKFGTPGTVQFKLNVFPKIPKGTLPRLRFGKSYDIKLRMVDLAGNSVPYSSEPEPDNESVVKDITYKRYEPVDPPQLIYGSDEKDGETAETMVIRSYDENPVKDKSIRHVLPPRGSIQNALTHGMFDSRTLLGSKAIKGIYEDIAKNKDEFTTDTRKENPESTSINVNYITDPMAVGVNFFISAMDPNPKNQYFDDKIFQQQCLFYANNESIDYDTWMAPKSFRIFLEEGPFSVNWKVENERKLTICLPKGFMVKVNYSSFWRPEDIKYLSGIYDIMELSSLTDEMGRHWLFSPWRTLTLVHAVPYPVEKPNIIALTSSRNFEETDARLNIALKVHGPSTGIVDIVADWEDRVDGDEHNSINYVSKKAKVFHFNTLYHVNDYVFGDFPARKILNNPFEALPHHFNDTKHRWVNYQIMASTRYKEHFFTSPSNEENNKPVMRNIKGSVNILSSARPMTPQVDYVIPNFEWSEHPKEDGTILRLRVSGLRVYIKKPWYSSGDGEKLAIVLITPNPDETEYSLSSWTNIYTTWGNDPTKISPTLPGVLSKADIFPGKNAFIGVKKVDSNNLYIEDGLSLDELKEEGGKANIVAYDLNYDRERQLYFADIMMNFGLSYFPFVRLALAAYQQHSVRKDGKDCCLSKVVQADYVQIPPPRSSSMKRDLKRNTITVAISGTLPALYKNSNYSTKIEFILEPSDGSKNDDRVYISLNNESYAKHSHVIIQSEEIDNHPFIHSHEFKLPPEIAKKPMWLKIFEYEVITYDTLDNKPNTSKDRMVFADVYELNCNK